MQRQDDGVACGAGAECKSDNCVDGVCCATACGGTCEACHEGLTGTASGTCAPVFGATDPDDECTGTDVCDGSGSCASLCGLAPTPPGGNCPGVCTGGCAGTTCNIDCSGAGCQGIVNCPPGFDCAVTCSGLCQSTTINCPDGFGCAVSCSGMQNCQDTVINCSSTGICSLNCGPQNQVCRDASLNCGGNDCTMTCAATGFPPAQVCGGGACACTNDGCN